MGIWAEIKYALNSTLGTSSFKSLDNVIGDKITAAQNSITTAGAIPSVRHIQRGTGSVQGNKSVTITLSGFTNLNKMVVIIQGGYFRETNSTYSPYRYGYVYYTSLSLSSLYVDSIAESGTNSSNKAYFSYQVIEFY